MKNKSKAMRCSFSFTPSPRHPVMPSPSALLSVFHSRLLLEPLYVAPDFGQFFQGHEDALLFALRGGRGTEHALARRNFFGHAGLGADHRPLANSDVIHDSCL